jgi:tRNA(Ser,Leu) C12 N-acetylase TAN1
VEWNIVVSVYQDGYRRARHALQKLGPVEHSPYHNVLLMSVADPMVLLAAVEQKTEENPGLYDAIARVAPAIRSFGFRSAEDFRQKAKATLGEWSPRLAGRSFHVRLHRRGDRRELPTPDIEKFLDDAVLAVTAAAGSPARISFTDPDVVIAVDTVDDRAGIGLWTRDDLVRHRLLRPD